MRRRLLQGLEVHRLSGVVLFLCVHQEAEEARPQRHKKCRTVTLQTDHSCKLTRLEPCTKWYLSHNGDLASFLHVQNRNKVPPPSLLKLGLRVSALVAAFLDTGACPTVLLLRRRCCPEIKYRFEADCNKPKA